MKANIPDTITRRRSVWAVVLTLSLSSAAFACDAEDQSDDRARIAYCNLSDPDCAEMPELEEAIEVVKSMGIDPDRESVEVWSGETEVAAVDSAASDAVSDPGDEVETPASAADTTQLPEASLSASVDAQQRRMACAGEDPGCHCCCYAGWEAAPGYPIWGCECNGCW